MMSAGARIVVVDDHPANVRLLEELLARWGYRNVIGTTDSSDVVALCEATRPDLLLLDLRMPYPDGFAVLERLAGTMSGPTRLPVLVLSGDIAPEARRRALSLGAQDFVHKPFDAGEVQLRVHNLLETRRLQIELHSHTEVLEHRVRARTRDLELAQLEVLDRLAIAAEFRDDSTHEHAQRVGRTAGLLAAAFGAGDEEARLVGAAAPLHDIGKIGVSDSILLKPGRLTTDEFELMKTHTVLGGQVLAGSGSELLQVAEQIAVSHHERWDGSGYPTGLSGAAIPFCARVTALADVFDALTHRRPYKEAWTVAAALDQIRQDRGSHFDPAMVDAFLPLHHDQLLSPVETTHHGGARFVTA